MESSEILETKMPLPLALNTLKLEYHKVTTSDGYLLTLTRVIVDIEDVEENGREVVRKCPVLIAHGLLCEGASWLLNTEDKCLPFILGKNGYDCWLANFRGTRYSKAHETLDKNSAEFWDFSWDEMARYDLPSMIDYILKETSSPHLNYVGHSMGCLIFFSFLSIYPAYGDRIGETIALAPSLTARHATNFFLKLGIIIGNNLSKIRRAYARPVWGGSNFSRHILPRLIPPFLPLPKLASFIFSTVGVLFGMFGRTQIESWRLEEISKNWPSTSSFKTILQMAQLYTKNEMRMYDYGGRINAKLYGEGMPPTYDLRKTSKAITIFSSEGDELCTARDVKKSSEAFTLRHYVHIEDKGFSHIDFLMGKDADRLIYSKILEIFDEVGGYS